MVTGFRFQVLGGTARRIQWALENEKISNAHLHMVVETALKKILEEKGVPPMEECILQDDNKPR